MTPISHVLCFAKRSATPSRLIVFTLLMLLIAAIGLLLVLQKASNSVMFNGDKVPVIRPAQSEVCVGAALHFATITETTDDEIPGRLEIDEAWCLAGVGGACKTVTPPNPRLPLLEPRRIITPEVSRIVPETLTPGVYHFWHTATDTSGRVTGYIVAPIHVLDCSQKEDK